MMQWILIVLLALHLLSGIAWTGMSFGIVRGLVPLEATPALRGSQRGAAVVAILAGLALWALAHRDRFYIPEMALAAGAALALIAAIAHGIAGARLKRALATGLDETARKAVGGLDRLSVGCLVLAIILMAASKYL
jgi:hypothetical protein